MLDGTVETHKEIVDALRTFHKNGAVANLPDGVSINANDILITYGYGGTVYGAIQITRGQYAVTGVTKDDKKTITGLLSYNHSDKGNTTQQAYINALKCTDLNKDKQFASALIILTSECSRSNMVFNAVQKVLEGYSSSFSTDVWGGLSFAFTNYASTASFKSYKIDAGQSPWNPLEADDYKSYIGSTKFTGDRVNFTKQIEAVATYIM